jgi:CspA family cold shock protein
MASSGATVVDVRSTGTVRIWYRSEGWGVIDSPDTPGGCFAHFSHLWNDDEIPKLGPGEVVEISGGFRELFEGETVDFAWEHVPPPGQDGYSFRASTVRPRGRQAPHRIIRQYKADSAGFRLQMGPLKRPDRNDD